MRFIVGAPDPRYPLPGQRMAPHPSRRADPGRAGLHPALVMGTKTDPRRRTIFYQYRADRARRGLRGIDQQIIKAEKPVAGQTPVKRNRFVELVGGTKSVNRGLETKGKTRAAADVQPRGAA